MSEILLGMFGLVGVFARYSLGRLFENHPSFSGFPMVTLLINIVGSLVIGFVYQLSKTSFALSEPLRLGVMVGLLGGFTTFSSFSLQVLNLLEKGAYGRAASYFLLSPTLGVLACGGGVLLVRFAQSLSLVSGS